MPPMHGHTAPTAYRPPRAPIPPRVDLLDGPLAGRQTERLKKPLVGGVACCRPYHRALRGALLGWSCREDVGIDACGVEVVSSEAPDTLWLAAASLVRIDIRWDAGSAVARSG